MSKQQRKQIAEAYVAGASAEEIAKVLGLALADVQRVIKKDAPESESEDEEIEYAVDDSVVQAALNRGPTQYGGAKIFGNCAVISARARRIL